MTYAPYRVMCGL